MKLNELTLEEKIAQLFIYGTREHGVQPDLEELIVKHKIGGVILFKKNYNSYEEMLQYIHKLQQLNQNNKVPLWIGIDQEGGRCNRMPPEFLNIYSAGKLAKAKDINLIRRAARVTGKMLKQTGVHLNFAPILDIQRFPDDHAIGNRSYGATLKDVETYAFPVMQELKKQGILSVSKHFPGHGLVAKDSHLLLASASQPLDFIEKNDMAIFKKAIQQGVDGIMLGHIQVPAIDKYYPASLSPIFIEQYLREKYQYKGLLVTDDLKMLSIRLHYGSARAGKLAFLAGNDLILNHTSKASIVGAISSIGKLVNQSDTLQESLDNRVSRILSYKQQYGVSHEFATGVNIEEINEEIKSINTQVKEGLSLPL